ncbi:hypothetical protein FHS85_002581 [Rhodoligotrophos appendicifer]|nr:hypothetical protein [Rhodoligotrophos appendicifer]
MLTISGLAKGFWWLAMIGSWYFFCHDAAARDLSPVMFKLLG